MACVLVVCPEVRWRPVRPSDQATLNWAYNLSFTQTMPQGGQSAILDRCRLASPLDVGRNGGTRGAVLEVDHGCEACRDPAHIARTSVDVRRNDPWTVIPPCHCRDQCRGREGPRLAPGPVKVQR